MSTLCITIPRGGEKGPLPAMVTVDKDMKPVSLVLMRWKPIDSYSDYVKNAVDEAIKTGNFV